MWTEEKVEKLKTMWADGCSGGAIAQALGTTRNAVISKVHRLKLENPPGTHLHAGPKGEASGMRKKWGVSLRRLQKQWRENGRRIEKAEPIAVPPPSGTKTLLQLTPTSCRWPYGHPGTDGFSYCGEQAIVASYCASHARIAFEQPRRR